MSRRDLPRDQREHLDYRRLVSVLDMIDGESVIVRIASREDDDHSTAGISSIVGEITHQPGGRYPGDEFSIGNPYPDRDLGHLGGGIVFIRQDTFQSATLVTTDGNDYFGIDITTSSVDIHISDGDSTYP